MRNLFVNFAKFLESCIFRRDFPHNDEKTRRNINRSTISASRRKRQRLTLEIIEIIESPAYKFSQNGH